MTRILLIQGHPDRSEPHLCDGLASAYAEGARGAGHEVKGVVVAAIDWEQGVWLGDMPALLKGFLEQVARPGFAFAAEGPRTAFTRKGMRGLDAAAE